MSAMSSRNHNLLRSEERGGKYVSGVLSPHRPNNGFENISNYLFVAVQPTTKKTIVR